MAVGTDQFTLLDLCACQADATPADEDRDLSPLLDARQVIELHRRGMEPTAAICARPLLEIAHPLEKLTLSHAFLLKAERAPRSVVGSVVRLATRLAPPLVPVTPAMEGAQQFLSAALGAAT